MTYSTNNYITGARAALCAAAFLMISGACTEVDDRLGANLVSKNQRMEIEVTSPENGIRTYLYREPHIPSSRSGYAYFGRTVDADGIFGAQKSSVLLQFSPATVPYSNAEGYGLDPIVDSARIIFTLNDTRGDTTVVQRFDVWEIDGEEEEPLTRDTSYYTDFPIEKYKGRRLFQFSHTGKRDVMARLSPTAAGKEYLNRIVNLPWDEYIDDSLFRLKFRGLYVTPADDSPANAALYGTALSTSGLQLFVRNHDTLDVSAIYDTVSTLFSFNDTDASSTAYNNVSINMSSFDYTGSVLGTLETETGGFTDTLPDSSTQPMLYVQAMGGVGAQLRFTDELVEEIRNLKYTGGSSGGTVGKDIFINQAMMRIWITDPSMATLDRSMARLGSYLYLKSLLPIPDYQYAYEVYQNSSSSSSSSSSEEYILPYNGYLNRSNGYYELDVTSYIQQLAKVKEGDPDHKYIWPTIYLAPEAYSVMGLGQSVLKGFGSDQPVSIRITYTIIEG